MRVTRAAACVLMFGLGLFSRLAAAQTAKSIRAEELGSTVQVIGRLQQPLGTVVPIEATIVDGDSLRQKQHQGAYLLRIESVAGKRLATPEIMTFSADSGVFTANKSLVGQRVTLLGYETGSFSGIPKNLPHELIWQDTDFQFSARLVILKRVNPAAQR